MAYTKQTWADSDATRPVSAARMNVLETQYDQAMSSLATTISLASTAYQKPGGGIPSTDFTSSVQATLTLAAGQVPTKLLASSDPLPTAPSTPVICFRMTT
jgi:hypothetical protein